MLYTFARHATAKRNIFNLEHPDQKAF